MNGGTLEAPPAETLSMRFALEPYSEKLVQEMRPLWDEHFKELPQLWSGIDPNLSVYSLLQKTNILRIYTARIGAQWENTLVGYQVFCVMKHPHRQYSLEANQDILFLDPEVRKGMVAIKFLKWCDLQLELEGVKAIFRGSRVKKDIGSLYQRMGYECFDLIYVRKINYA